MVYVDKAVGSVTYHEAHGHFHFDGWGRYELWTQPAYDAWVASGRTSGTPQWTSPKTTSCVLDEEPVEALANTSPTSKYVWTGCNLAADNTLTMGLSPGWGDTYDYYRFEQWIDLGQATLTDGRYVLRSVTDDGNVLWESEGKADPAREADNESLTPISVVGGSLVDQTAPSGTLWVNGVDTQTSNTVVNLKVLGRDDISGVDQVRVSNNGSAWSTRNYTGVDSTPQELTWDLADTRYGGSAALGDHTVSVQFHDRSGKWSASVTDTIALVSCAAGVSPSTYAQGVAADAPVSHWRLGESCGTTALDERAANPGTYVNGPSLKRPSLLVTDGANSAVGFDGINDYVTAPSSNGLNPTGGLSVEAWIQPATIPAAGGWASVLTKAESYSLQFNGPRLEFTVMQNGARRRLQAPAGAVTAGSTYHVVGTFDGATQRLYLNGQQVASVALGGAASATSNPLRIGSWDGGGEFFAGVVDEAAVYAKALTPARVAAHYSAGHDPIAPPPPAPTNVAASLTDPGSVNLTWTDNATNETGFVVDRSTSAAFTTVTSRAVAPDVTSVPDGGLSPATTYYYRVKATGTSGDSAYSSAVSVTTPSAVVIPSPPSGLMATATSPTSAWLAWTDNSTNETAFVLERSVSPAFTSAITTLLPANAVSSSDASLAPSTTYYFRIRARGADGDSAVSNTASATTPAVPPPSPTYAAVVAGDAPVSYWRLGETTGSVAADARSANPGTYLDGPTLGQGSLIGSDPANRAVAFDGVNDQVQVPNSASLSLGGSFSLETWIKPASIPSAGRWASIVTKAESYSLQFNGPKLEFTVITGGTRQRLQAPAGAIGAGSTYHVVATFDGSQQRLYVNGAQVASRAYRGSASTVTSPLRIGSWDGTGEYFAGVVDEVAVYNRVLTPAQVANHTSAGRSS